MTGAQTLDLAFAGSAFENSLKFWTIARGENLGQVRWGRIGTKGEALARKSAKVSIGYKFVGDKPRIPEEFPGSHTGDICWSSPLRQFRRKRYLAYSYRGRRRKVEQRNPSRVPMPPPSDRRAGRDFSRPAEPHYQSTYR